MTALAGTMTGPEHYRAAETLLVDTKRMMSTGGLVPLHSAEQQSRMVAEAQVHATLALAAATAALIDPGMTRTSEEWRRHIVPRPPAPDEEQP